VYQGLAYEILGVMPEALATGLFTSRCTLQQPDVVMIGAGQPSNTYIDVPGMVGLLCMDAPISENRLQATEVKDLKEIMSLQIRHVVLGGCYPAVPNGEEHGWIAILTDLSTGLVTTYDLLGAEVDSQGTQTRLHIRTATL
jgi:hypothetical protein